jgi:hypothetical protein
VVAMESADVVISAVGYAQLPDQTRIISAIKDAGNINVTYCTSMENVICVYLLVCCGHFNIFVSFIVFQLHVGKIKALKCKIIDFFCLFRWDRVEHSYLFLLNTWQSLPFGFTSFTDLNPNILCKC